jgi:hypothetical protein
MAFENYVAPMRRITASEVFACIGVLCFESDVIVEDLTADSPLTTIYGRWLQPRCRHIRKQLQEHFDIDVPEQVLRICLFPLAKRKISDLCDLVASRARIEEIADVNLFGSRCRKAGAFLAIRSVLQKSGIETRDITPSTALRGVLIANPDVVWRLQRLAPLETGALQVSNLPATLSGIVAWLSLCGISLCSCMGMSELAVMSAMSFAVAAGVAFVLARVPACQEVFPANLKNFRDLATLLAGERSKGFPVTATEH